MIRNATWVAFTLIGFVVACIRLVLGDTATPLGLKARRELQDINPVEDVASNPMIMFLVLNTAGITLIPTSTIAIRQALAAEQGLTGFNGADIFLHMLIGTFISFAAGLVAVAWVQCTKLLQWPQERCAASTCTRPLSRAPKTALAWRYRSCPA